MDGVFMKKRIIPLILTALCVLTLITGAVLAQQQRTLADKLIRLHVVANSDSQYDQMVKLRVRDAVLDETQRWLSGADDPAAALAEHLGEIEAAAGQTLRACGSGETVSVRLQNELFSRRNYETFSLPSGVYRTLRVTIGDGAGHNWWCVVFPALCMSASSDELEQAAEAAGITDGELRLITEDGAAYKLKFRTVELFEKIQEFLTVSRS